MAGKIYPDAASALEGLLFDGMLIASGGFGISGIPVRLIDAVQAAGTRDITAIAPDQEDDFVLCGRKQRVRAAVAGR